MSNPWRGLRGRAFSARTGHRHHAGYVLIFVKTVAADVFEMLKDERQTSSHDNVPSPKALSQVLTLGERETKKITRHLLDSEVLYAHEREWM